MTHPNHPPSNRPFLRPNLCLYAAWGDPLAVAKFLGRADDPMIGGFFHVGTLW